VEDEGDAAPDVRRGLVKMGDKSEAFCRETLMVLSQNTHLLPPSFDLAHLDKLRPRAARLCRLLEKRPTMARPRSIAM